MKNSTTFHCSIITLLIAVIFLSISMSGCSSKKEDIGIGPVKKVELGEIDMALVEKGKQVFEQMTFQDVSQDDARAILEYLRTIE